MQRRFLVRTRGLASFRQALVERALAGGPAAARRRVVVVPTRAAGSLLRLTMEQAAVREGRTAIVCPDLLTREEWLVRMLLAVDGSPRWLSRLERRVILERACRATLAGRRVAQPFELRPGLVAAMLDFYDEIRRRQRRIRAFARTIFDELRVEQGTDRGSDDLINQTRFLGYAFLAYERAARASGGADEHELGRLLLASQPVLPFDDLVIAVADHPADPRGLWPADFDLIGRLRTLASVQIVMTDEAHDAGFRERVEQELPGVEEVRAPDVDWSPVLVSLPTDAPLDIDVPIAIARDREEELRGVARHVRARAADTGALTGTTAVVFHRPLPYLYLAQQVMNDARVPYQAADALPLATEPYAALLDLALAVPRTGGGRDAALALLRSPLARFDVDGRPVVAQDVAALDVILTERRATGGADTFLDHVDGWQRQQGDRAMARAERARRAASAAAGAARDLRLVEVASTGSGQVRALSSWLRAAERTEGGHRPVDERYRRARAAVLAVLDQLADALLRHDDRPRTLDELAAIVYHAIEDRTFVPLRPGEGVHLVDAAAARFGEIDDVFLVGLVETDWAERPRRSFFYSAGLLKALGWPQDVDQTLAQQAAFRDVLTLARRSTRLSAFQLEGDAAVALSTMIDAARGLPRRVEDLPDQPLVFADETLTCGVSPIGLEAGVAGWFAARKDRPDLSSRDYSGFVAPRTPQVYSVSRVDRYVSCPFKYFSEHVLRLSEEREDAAGMTPLERGTFLHLLLERFYRDWQDSGHGSVTAANMPDAQALFATIADQLLAGLPAPDRIIEHLRIVGSIVAPGVADRVLELEAAMPGEVSRRLLEVPIEGEFTFPAQSGLTERRVAIRGKADRVDVLADRSLRVVDYKLGRMPDLATSVQLAVYAHCIRQSMEQQDAGGTHPVAAAMYLAFGDDRRFEGRLADSPGELEYAIHARTSAFAAVIDRIEGGEFPPQPRRTSECTWCGYAGVCRKEYRIEDDDAAESV